MLQATRKFSFIATYVFLILINNWRIPMATFKFDDDATVAEIIYYSHTSREQTVVDHTHEWSHLSHMNVNTQKTERDVS
jgi:hypothetical protein